MAWLDDIARDGFDDPAGVIVEVSTEEVDLFDLAVGKIALKLRVRDMRGEPYVGEANVFLPPSFAQGARGPVWFNCGYEVEAPMLAWHLGAGRAVATSCNPPEGTVFAGSNPLVRGPNADYVLAHLVRGARFLDPTSIVYGGGSAGGYATLMTIAEAFPVAGGVALGPPVNLGYQTAYFAKVFPRFVEDPPKDHPVIQMITAAFAQWPAQFRAAYGEDYGGVPFLEHSPVAHVDRITCPVLVMTSTADFLVPVDQFSRELAGSTLADPPKHVEIAAEDLDASPRVAVRLLDVLGQRADVQRVPVPEDAADMKDFDMTMQAPKAAIVEMSAAPALGKQWLVAFIDEGPIVLGATHGRYSVQANYDPFVRTAVERGISVDQLTSVKLEQLLDRYVGTEWLATGYTHLDEPAAERADVLRGLALYCGQSPDHARHFEALYRALDETRRALPEPSAWLGR